MRHCFRVPSWARSEPLSSVQAQGRVQRETETTPTSLAAPLLDLPSVTQASLLPAGAWDMWWLCLEVTFCLGGCAQSSLQVTDYTFDRLHYPSQAQRTTDGLVFCGDFSAAEPCCLMGFPLASGTVANISPFMG